MLYSDNYAWFRVPQMSYYVSTHGFWDAVKTDRMINPAVVIELLETVYVLKLEITASDDGKMMAICC